MADTGSTSGPLKKLGKQKPAVDDSGSPSGLSRKKRIKHKAAVDVSGTPSGVSLEKHRKRKASVADSGSPSDAPLKKLKKKKPTTITDSGSPSDAPLKELRKHKTAMADSDSHMLIDAKKLKKRLGSGSGLKKDRKKRPVEEVAVNTMDDDLDFGFYSKKVSSQDHEAWRRYWKQVEESDGFDIFDYPGAYHWAPIVPLPLDDPDDGDLTMAAAGTF